MLSIDYKNENITVGAGWSISDINQILIKDGYYIPIR